MLLTEAAYKLYADRQSCIFVTVSGNWPIYFVRYGTTASVLIFDWAEGLPTREF